MSEGKCPLGEDCDLTLAYMMGAEKAKDTIKALRAEVDRLQGNLRAELGDHIHGTPCAQIRWQQEREELQAANERLRAALTEIDFICLALIAAGFHHKNILEIHQMTLAALDGQPAPDATARKGEQRTICEDCGNANLAHDRAVWTDDGTSYCPTCRPRQPAPGKEEA